MSSDPFRAIDIAPAPLPKPKRVVIADGFKPTNGRKPRTGETRLVVQFRCGMVDDKHTYRAADLRWTDTGDSFDIVAVKRA